MYDIKVHRSATREVRVEPWGMLDLYPFDEPQEAPDNMWSLRKPTVVELSSITFQDIQSIREPIIASQLYAQHLIPADSSQQARACVEAFGMAKWFHAFCYKYCWKVLCKSLSQLETAP